MLPDVGDADLLEGHVGERDGAEGHCGHRDPAHVSEQGAPRVRERQRTLEALEPLSAHARLQVGRRETWRAPRPSGSHPLARAIATASLVGVHHLERNVLPGEALHAVGGALSELAPTLRLVVKIAQGLGERLRIARRHQQTVDPIT